MFVRRSCPSRRNANIPECLAGVIKKVSFQPVDAQNLATHFSRPIPAGHAGLALFDRPAQIWQFLIV